MCFELCPFSLSFVLYPLSFRCWSFGYVKAQAKHQVKSTRLGFYSPFTIHDLLFTVLSRLTKKSRSPYIEIPLAGRSSNGRTADSESAYRGSNPCLPAKPATRFAPSGRRRVSQTLQTIYEKYFEQRTCYYRMEGRWRERPF